ncbi:MAG: polymer-forming cytoskeletal protein [Patescibacteria group bacterium]
MFKKDTKGGKDTLKDEIETIIGPSVKIEGEFSSNGNIMIAGVVSGKLSTTQNLRVEEQAKISADIKANEAVIAGEVNGNIKITGHLEILSTAKINGDIQAGSIAMEQGAILNGTCTMGKGADENQNSDRQYQEQTDTVNS